MRFVDPIRDAKTVQDIGDYLKTIDYKWFVMYSIGIYSGLRISDILALKVRDVKGKKEIRIGHEIKTNTRKKDKKWLIFPINAKLEKVLNIYTKDRKPWEWLIPNKNGAKVSRIYAYKIIHNAGLKFGLENLGTHTMRKTFGYHFYLQTKDLVLLMKILNHTDESKTLRYIGIEQSTINEAMRKFDY